MKNESKSIEDLLDRYLHEINQGNKTLEECLQEYPEHRAELEPLLNLSSKLLDLKILQASESFRTTSPIRVINRIQHGRAPKSDLRTESSIREFISEKARLVFSSFSSSSSSTVKITSVIIIVIFGLLLLSSGVFIASAKSNPGEFLYSTKIFFEQMELRFTQSDVRDSQIHLTHANNRMDEASRLVSSGQYEYLDKLITEYTADILESIAIVFDSNSISEQERLVLAVSLLEDLALKENQLLSLLSTTPDSTRPILEESLRNIRYGHAAIVDSITRLRSNSSLHVGTNQEPPRLIDPGVNSFSTEFPQLNNLQSSDQSVQLTPYLSQTVFPSVNGTPFPWWYLDPRVDYNNVEWPSTWPTFAVPLDEYPFPLENPLQDIDPDDLPDIVKTLLPDNSRDRTPVPRTTRQPRP